MPHSLHLSVKTTLSHTRTPNEARYLPVTFAFPFKLSVFNTVK